MRDSDSVVLASPQECAAFLPLRKKDVYRRRPLAPEPPQPLAKKKKKAKRGQYVRCRCGTCPTCRDNAKWESRFDRLFADSMKEYYTGADPFVRRGSVWNEL